MSVQIDLLNMILLNETTHVTYEYITNLENVYHIQDSFTRAQYCFNFGQLDGT